MEKESMQKVFMAMVIAATMALEVSATNHTVGGASGWDLSSDIPGWSANATFHSGDFLVFNYTPQHDVLEVNETEFAACRTIDPIDAYTDGETVIPLSQPGVTRYFICGRSNYCSRGLKLQVHILSTAPNPVTPNPVRRPQRSRPKTKPRAHPHPRPRPRPRPPTVIGHPHHPPPDKGTKDAPAPKSGAWGLKQDLMPEYRFLTEFLAVAPVMLRLLL